MDVYEQYLNLMKDIDRLKAQRELTFKQLKEKFGVSTIEEVRQKIEELKQHREEGIRILEESKLELSKELERFSTD